jgi:hypothetical protein
MGAPHFISKFAGLVDSVNPYSDAPEGGCFVADNAVIRSKNLIESRRGYSSVTSASPINALGWKDGKLLCLGWDDAGRGITGQLRSYDFTAGAFTALPMTPGSLAFDRPGGVVGQHTRFISAQKATYFQSKYGLTKVEAISAAVCKPAIQPRDWAGNNGWASAGAAAAGGSWLVTGFQVSYRITVCRKGANNEFIESEPSPRFIVQNTSGGPLQVQLQIQVPYMFPLDAFLRVYRSKQQANGSTQSEELFLVGEFFMPATDPVDPRGYLVFANSYGSFISRTQLYTDPTPDAQLGPPLYTNPISGGGIASANSPAPLAADMAYFKNRLLLLNTTDVQRYTLKIIGTGTGGIVDGDTITINGVKFTWRTSPGVALTDVQIVTAGTIEQNLSGSAAWLAGRVNQYFSTLTPALSGAIMAHPLYVDATSAGLLLLQGIVPGGELITIRTSSAAGWGADYTRGVTSDTNPQIAGISWSKQDQPEAFPLSNAAIVGDASSAGQRIIALKEAALIFKQNNNNPNDGLWRWTDDGVNVALQIADPTVRLIAPETAQPLGGYVFALCDQGVMLFTENGQSVNVSHDEIERELLKLIAYVGRDTLANLAFAVPYELEGQYILCLPEAPNAVSCTVQYVYSVRTETWTRWRLPGVIAGTVDPNTGKLVWAMGPVATTLSLSAQVNSLWVERKNFDSLDYQDPGFSVACPVNTTTATMVFAGDGRLAISVGDLIEQAQATYYVRQRVKTVTYNSTANQTTVTLDAVPTHPWSNLQNVTVLKAIQSMLSFLPFHAGKPLTSKEWGECLLLFRYCDLDWINGVEWGTEIQMGESALEQISGNDPRGSPAPLDLFAATPFDTTIFDRPAKNQIVKCTMPQHSGMCSLLSLKLTLGNALCRWELAGINLPIDQEAADVVR